MINKKYELYVGLFDEDSKKQEIDTISAYKILQKEAMERFDGATLTSSTGIYKHEDGTIVVEPTLKIELLFCSKEAVKDYVNFIKKVLNQESVAVQVSEIDSDLW